MKQMYIWSAGDIDPLTLSGQLGTFRFQDEDENEYVFSENT